MISSGEKDEIEFTVRNDKVKIIFNGLEIQDRVYRFEYHPEKPKDGLCASVEICLVVPIL